MTDFRLVRIRLKQIEKESGGLGPFYLLLIAGFFSIVLYYLYQLFQSPVYSIIFIGLMSSVLISVHFSRKDSYFIWTKLENPARILFTEYLFYTVLFFLPSLLTLQFWVLAVNILFCYFLSRIRYFPSRKPLVFPWLNKIIPF